MDKIIEKRGNSETLSCFTKTKGSLPCTGFVCKFPWLLGVGTEAWSAQSGLITNIEVEKRHDMTECFLSTNRYFLLSLHHPIGVSIIYFCFLLQDRTILTKIASPFSEITEIAPQKNYS